MANEEFDFNEVKKELQQAVNEYLSEEDKEKQAEAAGEGPADEPAVSEADETAVGTADGAAVEADGSEEAADPVVPEAADDADNAPAVTDSAGIENADDGNSNDGGNNDGGNDDGGDDDGDDDDDDADDDADDDDDDEDDADEDDDIDDDDFDDDDDEETDEDDDFIERILRKNRRAQIAKKLIITIVLLAVTFAIAAGVYLYMSKYFKSHFISGSTINGVDVSGETAKEVKEHIGVGVEDYSLTLKEMDGQKELLSASDIGLVYDDDNSVEKLLEEQNETNWVKQFFKGDKSYTINAETQFDEEKTRESVKNLDCISSPDIVAPKNAELLQDDEGKYYISEEIEGNKVDEARVTDLVLAAVEAGIMEVDLVENDCYLHPSVRSDDESLKNRMEAWNKYLSVDLTYKFGDNEERIDSQMILQHITDNGTKVTISLDWIKPMVYEWGQKYDTFGLTREFTTHSGKKIQLPAGGDYGWCINKDATIDEIKGLVENGESGEREPIWLFKAMGWDNGDITGTYAEVSIPEQKLWVYKDGQLAVETDVVTGKPTEARETKVGIYAIDGKKPNATLGTLDVQGYSSPVSWWLPFNGGQGLHDAPWRSSFGDSIYLTNGSHGCVNIPEERMEAVYNSLEIGNAVIVYDAEMLAGGGTAAAGENIEAESATDASAENADNGQ